jgi:hypothetical protein
MDNRDWGNTVGGMVLLAAFLILLLGNLFWGETSEQHRQAQRDMTYRLQTEQLHELEDQADIVRQMRDREYQRN